MDMRSLRVSNNTRHVKWSNISNDVIYHVCASIIACLLYKN